MKRVILLLSGPGHLMNLAVAAYTLRKHYDGILTVFAWKESIDVVKRIARDPRIDAEVIPWEPMFHGHSDTYVDKTRLIQWFNHNSDRNDSVLFLDADVTVHGTLDHLFDCIDLYGFVATQFCDWVTTGGTISGRLRSLREFPSIDQSLIDLALARAWPSVNTGIFGGRPNSSVLSLWHRWTYDARSTFIPDEKVMHLLTVKFGPSLEIAVAGGGRWNCSPRLQPAGLDDKDVIIYHHHGDMNVRPSKCQKSFDMWKAIYEDVSSQNIGGIRSWISSVPNKHLRKALEEKLL